MRVTLDYETRSRVELRKTGTFRYATDPSTEVMCLAWKYEGDPTKYLWHKAYPNARINDHHFVVVDTPEGPKKRRRKRKTEPVGLLPYIDGLPEVGRGELEELIDAIASGRITEVEAHNAMFERVITDHVMKRQVPDFKIPAAVWRCSAAKAASFALPRDLKGGAKALGLAEQKDAGGKALITKLCSPNDKGVYCEDVESLLAFFEYCRQDVATEEELSSNLRPLPPIELATWQLDQNINLRGVMFDRALCVRALAIAGVEQERADIAVRAETNGAVETMGQRDELLKWLQGQGYPADNLQGDVIDDILGSGRWDLKPAVRSILMMRRSVGRTSTKKYESILAGLCADDRARDLLSYYGANTGRWAGRRVQPHNFPRGTITGQIETLVADIMKYDVETLQVLYGDPMELLASSLRGTIIAPPGRVLNVADYAAVEARVTAWIAGQLDMLDVFLSGKDVYKVMAAAIFQVPLEAVTKEMRQLGKAAILGLGFQMGAKKFVATCADQYGVTVTESFAEGVVKAYRQKNDKIVTLWSDMNECAIEAIRRGPGAPAVEKGKVAWAQRGRFLHVKLPSGRMLSYCDPFVEQKLVEGTRSDGTTYSFMAPSIRFMGLDSQTHQWARTHTYGGSLVENIVQATARDLMRDAMLRLEASGTYETVLTVHDELVAESDEDKGSVYEFEQLVSATEPWAAGMPVKAEAWRGARYHK
jgi:DNA polymerase